ncbi:MAG: hypothetical protein LBQ65_07110, partial [Tannerellaceae bacterium]|nr:hypothetical protein [Tannerellaceae bacterium]
MMHQLGLAYPETGTRQENYDKLILPRLQAACSDVRLKPNNPERPDENWVWDSGTSSVGYASGGIARSSYGLWTNYIQAWEPGGDYFTGEKFYQALPLHDLSGLTAASWESRRALIFEEVQKIYGYIPPEASKLQIDWTLTEERQTSSFRQYKLSGAIDASAYPGLKQAPLISAVLRIPASARTKVPLVIHFAANYNKNRTYDETLWDTMAPEGFGLLYFDPLPLQPDRGDALTSYLIGLLNKGQWRQPLDWGTLVAWSWGVSRLIDYFEAQDSPVDASKVALTGHSRYGKA